MAFCLFSGFRFLFCFRLLFFYIKELLGGLEDAKAVAGGDLLSDCGKRRVEHFIYDSMGHLIDYLMILLVQVAAQLGTRPFQLLVSDALGFAGNTPSNPSAFFPGTEEESDARNSLLGPI